MPSQDEAIQKDVSEAIDSENVSEQEKTETTEVEFTRDTEAERIALEREQYLLHEEEEGVEEEQPQIEITDSPLTERDGEWYTIAKVNGEEQEIPWNEVLAQYQKKSSADQRLQEAAVKANQLADWEKRLHEYRDQLASQKRPSTDAAARVSPSSDANDDLYGQYHEALFQGDEKSANQLMKQIRAAEKPSAPEIDVNEIISRTKNEMREEERQAQIRDYESLRKDAVSKFHEEYPDIINDSSLLAVADAKSAELYNADPTRDPWEIMQECGEYARAWLFEYVDNLGGKKQKVREERKQAMDEVTPRNVRSSIGEDEPEHESYSDIIAEMKQARHQAA